MNVPRQHGANAEGAKTGLLYSVAGEDCEPYKVPVVGQSGRIGCRAVEGVRVTHHSNHTDGVGSEDLAVEPPGSRKYEGESPVNNENLARQRGCPLPLRFGNQAETPYS